MATSHCITQSLDLLQPGESAIVHSINAIGALGCRLRDMGIMPGVIVNVTGFAPLGDPMSIALPGYELSLRRSEAQEVRVQTLAKVSDQCCQTTCPKSCACKENKA